MTINKLFLEKDGLKVGENQLTLTGGNVDVGQNLGVRGLAVVDNKLTVGTAVPNTDYKLEVNSSTTNGNLFLINGPGGQVPNFVMSGPGEQTFRFHNTATTGSTRVSWKMASRNNTDWTWIMYTDVAETGVEDWTLHHYKTGRVMYVADGGNIRFGYGSPTIPTQPAFKIDTDLGTVAGNTGNFGYNIFADATTSVGYSGYNLQLNNSTANASGYLRLARTLGTSYLGLELASQSRDGIRFLTNASSPVETLRVDASGNLIVGNGDSSATPTSPLIRGTNASGTNINGGNVSIQGGLSTGTGTGGKVAFLTGTTLASSATLQTATERMSIAPSAANTTLDLVTAMTTANLFAATATTVNFANAATTLTIGNTTTAAQTVNMFTASTGASTYNFATGATLTGTTKTLNIGTAGATGSTTNINFGSVAGGTITANTVIKSGVAAGATALDLAATDGYASVRVIRNSNTVTNADGMFIGYANGNSGSTKIYGGGSTTVSLTVNSNSSASTSPTTGSVVIAGGLGVTGNINISGDLTVNGTTTTVNSSTLVVDDKNIELGAVVSATISATGTIGSIAGAASPWTATITGMASTTGLVVGSAITATNGTGSLGAGGTYIVASIVSSTSITYTATGGTIPVAGTVTAITTTGATDLTADGGGITLKGATDKTFTYNNTSTRWQTNIGLAVSGALTVGTGSADGTVTTNGAFDLILNTNAGTNSGSITINDGVNGNIILAPNGTGDVYIDADTLRVGDANTAATITSNGTGNLILSTNAGTNSGTITINQGANGNITIVPNGTGDVGVGTASPSTRLSVGAKVVEDNTYTYDNNSLYVVHQTATATAVLNDPQEVLLLGRQGTVSQAFGAAASFRLSRYENNGVNSRTRLDLVLAHNSFLTSPTTILTARSDGSVGLGTTTPSTFLHIYNAVTGNQNVPGINLDRIGNTTEVGVSWLTAGTKKYSLLLDNDSTDNLTLYKWDGTGSGFIQTWKDGLVGIGTQAPAQKLSVAGTIGISETGSTGNRLLISTSALGGIINQNDNSPLSLQIQGSTAVGIYANRYVGINTGSPEANLHVYNSRSLTSTYNISTVSAIDATLNTITFSAAHNLTTGDLVFYIPGSGGAIGGLAGVTSAPTWQYFYYVRVVDTTTITLHNTGYDAAANQSVIDITGTLPAGTHTFRKGVEWSVLQGFNSNASRLHTFQYRHTDGTDWTGSSTRIQQRIDLTPQAYLEFNPPGSNYGLAFGSGNNWETFRINNSQELVLGLGETYSSAVDRTLRLTNASGTNINAGTLSIQGGLSTGTGTGGKIAFKTGTIGTTGATLQTAVERMSIDTASAATTLNLNTAMTTANVFNTTATTVNFAGAATTLNIGAASGTTTVSNNLNVTGNLTVSGTTITVNSTVTTLDDPIITLGGDTSTVEITKDRGVEAKWNGTTLTMTNYIGNGTTTVTGTVASTTGYAAGDIITISGATGTEQTKLNGTWTIASVPNATTFTFVVATAVTTGTYNTTLGTIVKSKNAFFGLDQSTGYFTFIPQANNAAEVFSGTQGDIQATNFRGNLIGVKYVDNTNETTIAQGHAGGVLYLNYRGASAAVTQINMCNGLAAGALTNVVGSAFVGNLTTQTSTALTINTGAAAATAAGNAITITGGAGGATSGAGGAVTVAAGNASTAGAAGALTLQGGQAVGTNQAGSTTTIKAGNGTGNQGSGSIVFQVAPAAASSATANTLGTVLTIANTGFSTFTADASFNSVRVGKGNNSVASNTAVGVNALNSTTASGTNNTALGNNAGIAVTSGTNNTLVGSTAGQSITTGSSNTIIGNLAGTATLADTVLIGAGTTERFRVDSTGFYVNGATNINLAADPIILNDISTQFDGEKAVFELKVDQTNINTVVDSKDLEVVVNGLRLTPYVESLTYPWFVDFDSFRGFRVRQDRIIIFNAPNFGDSASITLRKISQSKQRRKYPYTAASIALGD